MEAFLKADKNIQVLYAHNDQMALGAIQAIKEAGLQPGKDIIIVSVDAVKGAFEAMVNGELNCSVECSPLLGPQAVQAVKDLRAGKKLPARIWTIEGIFDETNAKPRPCRPASTSSGVGCRTMILPRTTSIPGVVLGSITWPPIRRRPTRTAGGDEPAGSAVRHRCGHRRFWECPNRPPSWRCGRSPRSSRA